MGAWLYGGLALLIVGLGIATWGQSKRIDVLTAQNAELRASLSTVTQANDAQKQTIADLSAANDEFGRQAALQAKAYTGALVDLSRANAARNAAQAALRDKEAKDRASKECQMVLAEDIAKSCPDIAADMVERAK